MMGRERGAMALMMRRQHNKASSTKEGKTLKLDFLDHRCMDLIVSKVLKRILSTYIKSCPELGTGNDINIGANSTIKLSEIELKEDVISKVLMLPPSVRLTHSRCGEMNVSVPLSLMKKPIIIRLKGISIGAHETEVGEGAEPVVVIKRSKKKNKRQLTDTILVEMDDFTLSLQTGESELLVTVKSLSTFLADSKFQVWLTFIV